MKVRGIGSVVLIGLTALAFGCVAGPEGAEKPVLREHLLGSFENEEQMSRWSADPDVTVERVGREATAGSHSLAVSVPENASVGVRLTLEDGDWSRFTSLRMDLMYPYEDCLTMAIRVDDAESADYPTRYNRDDGALVLVSGRNEIELPLRALASGGPGSRGLDLRRIRTVCLFPLGEHPERTFYLDNVRLEVLNPRAFQWPRMIDGFEEEGALGSWQLDDGVQVAPSEEQVTEGGRSLRVRLPEGEWPGIRTFTLPGNWLLADGLAIDIHNATDDTMTVRVWVRDGRLQEANVVTRLEPGENRIRISTDVLASLRLRTITGLGIFVMRPAAGSVLFVDNVRLRRGKDGPAPAEGAAAGQPTALLELDYSALASIARDTGFLANVCQAGEGGRRQLTRIRPVEKDVARHTVGVRPGPVVVSSFFLDDDTWFFDARTVDVPEGGTVVRYEPGDFAH